MTIDTEKHICADCGCIIEDDDNAVQLSNGDWICDDCRDRDYGFCEHCEEYVPLDELTEVEGRWICNDCLENSGDYFLCHDCEEWHSYRNDSEYETEYGYSVCASCYDNSYGRCENCRGIYLWDEMNEDDDGGWNERYCDNCYSARRRKLHQYGYKPSPEFKTVHDVFMNRFGDELMFGVELEVDDGESRDDCVEELCEDSEDIYCKTDGSLNRGIEIVTHPCTLEYHRSRLGWDKLAATALDYGYKSHNTDTCGLHIHVGIRQMAESTKAINDVKAKLVLLADRHWDNLLKFSRRNESRIREWASRPKFEYGYDETETVLNAIFTRHNGRYQAVNLTNSETVEFRLFRGTLKVDTLIASIELVSNITKYAMTHSVEDCMKSQWLDVANYEEYAELTNYLAERGLENVPNKAPVKFKERKELKVGDLVRVVDAGLLSSDRWMAGLRGWVAVIDGESVGVDFRCGDNGSLHDLGGKIKTNSGWWYNRASLVVE